MSQFQRSPSKVWFGSNDISQEWRQNSSSSPGSQDSGFSDTENSPPTNIKENENAQKCETPQNAEKVAKIPKDIFKNTTTGVESLVNFSRHFKEKLTPKKDVLDSIDEDCSHRRVNSEPSRKNRFVKNSPRGQKVCRSLFFKTNTNTNQYAASISDTKNLNNNVSHTHIKNISSQSSNKNITFNNNEHLNESAPTQSSKNQNPSVSNNLNKTAPAILGPNYYEEEITSFNETASFSSDAESELECLFDDKLDSPKHTSTPKNMDRLQTDTKKKLPLHLFLKYQAERIPPIHIETETDNRAVQLWLQEAKKSYEPECMTTFQPKSILADLNEKVTNMATTLTSNLRIILYHSRSIQNEYQHLNGEQEQILEQAQTLSENIMDFLQKYKSPYFQQLSSQNDEIQKTNSDLKSLQIISNMYDTFKLVQNQIIFEAIKNLVDILEDSKSELQLRGAVTGLTSIALRDELIIDYLIKADVVPILLILCEKCEGSSLRCLILRALSTICCQTSSVRLFEKFSGIQLISDILEDSSRPEPEKSEAVTVLAQVTAPWIENNETVRGLQDFSKKIIKSITKIIKTTRCCQNLLLCCAALTNMTTMHPECVKNIISYNTIKIILDTIKQRGTQSVYLLEQIATLIANVSASKEARPQLIEIGTPGALLSFLHSSSIGQDIEKRLQQKGIIALSRLCSDKSAAQQIVDLGGVEKLVRMCREKEERFNSDAVLVATLATLRKISEACGPQVLDSQDSQELVEPKLLDSFLAYSTQNESYV